MIPGPQEHRLAQIDCAAQGIITTLSTMHRASPKDRERMRMILRERLQDFVDAVMQAADQAGD